MRLVEPVKNLFGAIFFVSVGMLVDPKILADYALPIVVLVLAILFGQSVFGSLGYLFSGQTLKISMRCGFSMAQIGEFAFIIASLGLSLGVIGNFLYPVVVAVSVITTFLTPYMIQAADPAYGFLERKLPKRWVRRLSHLGSSMEGTQQEQSLWRIYLRKIAVNTLIYSILTAAVTTLMLTFSLPLLRKILPHWWANGACGVLLLALIAPFLRAIIVKNNHSEEFKALWTERRINRLPLTFTVLARVAIAASFLFYICNYLARFQNAIVITLALIMLTLMVLSRGLKHRSIRLERLFVQNLQSRDIAAQVKGYRRPLFEGHLLDRDLHISDFEVPEDSAFCGRALRDLRLRNRYGVHVSSILRGRQRINIPGGSTVIFPGDRIQAIGDDEQLHAFGDGLRRELVPEDTEIEKREMKLRQIILRESSPFIGKSLRESGIRDQYNCMVVGVEEGQKNLTLINPKRKFEPGDTLWVVGEQLAIDELTQQA